MRSRQTIHLERTPLVYVVLQVTVAPVLALKKYVPDLQERFRHGGFPRYREGFLTNLGMNENFSPTLTQIARFEFYDKDFRTGILLQPNAITIQTNSYSSFEKFQEIAQTAVGVFRETAEITLAERVGLRYVNWIRPETNHDVKRLLNPGLHGLESSALNARSVLRNFTLWCTTNIGTMLVRLYDQKGQFLPLDSQPIQLSYEHQIGPDETVTLLDLDHFSQQSFDFEEKAITDLAWKLHDPLDLAFREAITADARALWGEKK
jgi:uncharacterized protein (TIGR04255 family)